MRYIGYRDYNLESSFVAEEIENEKYFHNIRFEFQISLFYTVNLYIM